MNKKRDYSYFLGILSCVLAVCWVYLIYIGLTVQKEYNSDKMLSRQKIVLAIPETIASPPDKPAVEAAVATAPAPELASANIALLLDVSEYDDATINALRTLPKEVTIGISPYSASAIDIAKTAKENGQDVFVELPFASQNSDAAVKDYDLLPSFSTTESQQRLQKILDKVGGAVGVYNLGHEEFLNSPSGMAILVENLHKAHLFFLYGINGRTTVLESDNESVFTVEASDEVIPKNQDKNDVARELQALEEIAKNKGKAVIVVQFDNNNIGMLADWLKTLDSKNIKLLPIKALPKKIKISD